MTTFVCIGSGPSLTPEDCNHARLSGCFAIAVNSSIKAAPWAQAMYAMDSDWWSKNAREAFSFKGARFSSRSIPGVKKVQIDQKSSGAGAISLAIHLGAKKIVLIGYDCSVKNGTHWHGDHEATKNPNEAKCDKWQDQMLELADQAKEAGVDIVNCSRHTELKAFRIAHLEDELKKHNSVLVDGMHGLGDNLHQRAVIRKMMEKSKVWLKTPWPSLYHDLVGDNLRLVEPRTKLRTQAKNAEREAASFTRESVPFGAPMIKVSYPSHMVIEHRGVLVAMANQVGVDTKGLDFSLPVPWSHGLRIPKDRPIVIFRPLTVRKEWGGNATRNPDPVAYLELYREFRKLMPNAFVISIADLEDGKEWMIHGKVDADLEFHSGELNIERICALVRDAAMVFTAPGMALVLAQSIGTPVVSVFGGYESAYSFSAGAKKTPTLSIEPIHPCACFSHTHECKKDIDMPKAKAALRDWLLFNIPEKIECAA